MPAQHLMRNTWSVLPRLRCVQVPHCALQHVFIIQHPHLPCAAAGCGVDGVKVDVQSTITMFGYDSGALLQIAACWF